MPKKKSSDGSLPDSIINQVIEHTVGGFILFYFNNETGEPEQIMTFDSPAHCLALQKYISDWSEAVHELNLNQSIQSIQQNVREASEGDDEEDK